MKRYAPIAFFTFAALGCNDDPCAEVRTVEEALASTCNAQSDVRPQAATCTPRAGTICTVVGNGEAGVGSEDVAGTQTRTFLPLDVTIGPDNRKAYYLDWNNHTIREIGADYRVRTVAGTGELQDGEDPPVPPGTPRMPQPALRQRLNHPTQMVFDAQGRLLIAAWHNSMIKRVLNIGTPTAMIEDFCGTGGRNFAGDGGPAINAVLDLPVGVAVSPSGDVYISDQANQRIRRVDGMGIINTIVGNGMRAYAGDNGPALMASLNAPIGQAAPPAARIELDPQGNLYIADTGNNAIRKVTPQGIITTIAGNGTAGSTGDGGPARMALLNGPTDIDVAPDGTLYIADTQNSCVRAIGADGNIRTVVGRCGTRGFQGDGAPVATALLDRPYGIEVDTQGRLWVADTHNQRIRVVTLR
ncbi:MAG: hypothetical protein U0324_21820 [Polyangiales bacterium]